MVEDGTVVIGPVNNVVIGPDNEDTWIASFSDWVPKIELLPGENLSEFEGMRDSVLNDLLPNSPYQQLLVDNIIRLEWDILRNRRYQVDLIWAEYKEQAKQIFLKNLDEISSSTSSGKQDASKFAANLTSTDESKRAIAEKILKEFSSSPRDLNAKAYQILAKDLEIHERAVSDGEIRRRRLRNDFDQRFYVVATPVNGAVI